MTITQTCQKPGLQANRIQNLIVNRSPQKVSLKSAEIQHFFKKHKNFKFIMARNGQIFYIKTNTIMSIPIDTLRKDIILEKPESKLTTTRKPTIKPNFNQALPKPNIDESPSSQKVSDNTDLSLDAKIVIESESSKPLGCTSPKSESNHTSFPNASGSTNNIHNEAKSPENSVCSTPKPESSSHLTKKDNHSSLGGVCICGRGIGSVTGTLTGTSSPEEAHPTQEKFSGHDKHETSHGWSGAGIGLSFLFTIFRFFGDYKLIKKNFYLNKARKCNDDLKARKNLQKAGIHFHDTDSIHEIINKESLSLKKSLKSHFLTSVTIYASTISTFIGNVLSLAGQAAQSALSLGIAEVAGIPLGILFMSQGIKASIKARNQKTNVGMPQSERIIKTIAGLCLLTGGILKFTVVGYLAGSIMGWIGSGLLIGLAIWNGRSALSHIKEGIQNLFSSKKQEVCCGHSH